MRIQPTPPMPQTKPWSALQQDATQLGPEQNGLLHIGGVRWDIVNNEDGSTQELGVFRDTYIDPQAIQDVYLTIEPFSDKPGGSPGHAELHFEFKPESPVRDSLSF